MGCDIIIPVWNQLSLTRDCLGSIRENTDGEYSVIIVDNASDEATARYLDSVKTESAPCITVIRNDKNLGFIKAANQGIAASKAPYVCVLNNDTVVTKGWLGEMIRIAAQSADMGIVNPSSNNLGQSPIPGESLKLYAENIAKESGNFIELGACIGFCMLIKREVVEKIGVFDEIYGMGNFDDTDFSRRAVNAGYRCVRACGAYVYHKENSSFSKIKTFDDDFKRNREIFEFRWGKPKRIAYILDDYDPNSLRRLNGEAIALARNGNRVWYFIKGGFDAPKHSNIIIKDFTGRWFYPKTVFNILKKKKKFHEIFVGNDKMGRFLSALSFIHKAEIKYY